MLKLSEEEKALIRKLIYDVEEALSVLEHYVKAGIGGLSDAYAVRYALIQIVESLATVASRMAETYGTVVEGYVEAMRFLVRVNIVKPELGEKLVRLARLRNLLVHRYWVVDDNRVLKEARENGVETIREVLRNIRRLIEE